MNKSRSYQNKTVIPTEADLSRNTGQDGVTQKHSEEILEKQEQMLSIVRQKAKTLGRIPHPQDLPEICKLLSEYFGKWSDVIQAAGTDQKFFVQNSLFVIIDLEEEYNQYLKEMLEKAAHLGRAPLRNEIDSRIKEKLVKRCGSWRNVLYQVGLEPVTRIQPFSSTYIDHRCIEKKLYHQNTLSDCYYRVLNLDKQSLEDLIFIKELESKVKHLPEKSEVPEDIRLRLQSKCGSWPNVLFQIQYV